MTKKQLLNSFLAITIGCAALFNVAAQTTTLIKLDKKETATALSKLADKYTENVLKSRFVGWGIDPSLKTGAINLEEAWKIFEKKSDVLVAVVDTGIDPEHPFLKDNLINSEKKTINSQDYGVDFSKGKKTSQPFDTHGHGTHVAGIIKSIFPEVKIMALKYYNPRASGQANLEATIKALEYAVDQGVDIINYSGGGPEPAKEELEVLRKAEQKGILVVAAAGNERSDIDQKKNAYYPASYGLSNIITVTAHDRLNSKVESSNWGIHSVDLSAPGYRITSSIPGNRAAQMTGTSQATAFVSGVAALLRSQYPQLGHRDLKTIIAQSSKKESNMDTVNKSKGRLDAQNALELASKYSKDSKTYRHVATQ